MAFLRDLEDSLVDKGHKVIVGGDYNAKSNLWGSPGEDARGMVLAEWAVRNDFLVMNEGDKPTFERGASQSYIDITFVRERVEVTGWEVLDEESLDLHNFIAFRTKEVGDERNVWRYGRPDKSRARESFRND